MTNKIGPNGTWVQTIKTNLMLLDDPGLDWCSDLSGIRRFILHEIREWHEAVGHRTGKRKFNEVPPQECVKLSRFWIFRSLAFAIQYPMASTIHHFPQHAALIDDILFRHLCSTINWTNSATHCKLNEIISSNFMFINLNEINISQLAMHQSTAGFLGQFGYYIDRVCIL